MKVLIRFILFLSVSHVWLPEISAQQPLVSFEIKKPKKYEDKKLRSEKTGDKKWTVVRRFTQNGVTKFNWHFNANAKLEEIIERAKLSFKDDYTHLLSFYNYDLTQTRNDRELDSVISKANTGILIHDLRNTWIDNLYMLMGKAYYYKNILDTASFTFQYINYAFSPREKDGYDIPIGSNATEGGNAFTISTKEKTDLAHKVWAAPPSRNESFIWQIRTFLAADKMAEAAGLIETLRHDPQFPERLYTDLDEVQAYYFYKQGLNDSAAFYLTKALPNAANRQEKARWNYLIAQLYESVNQHQLAQEAYQRVVDLTLDPVMEVYARLNSIRQNKGDDKAIQQNIDELLKMARREKYMNYRDIILFAAAQIELERNNIAGAKALLLRATKYPNPTGDNANRSKAFLLLANLSFNDKLYPDAKRFYDSVTVVDTSLLSQQLYDRRKGALGRIVEQLNIISRQDSLQRIANLPEAEREALLRKMAKQLRKLNGLKEDDSTSRNSNQPLNNNQNASADLFGDNSKGDWYFYNASLKSKGFTEFKGKWGNRQNVDNWRRMDAIRQSINQAAVNNPTVVQGQNANGADAVTAFSYEGLLLKLPLTPVQLAASNDSIEKAQFALGKAYVDGLEDYYSAITVLENFLDRFGYSTLRPDALFTLYYCYTKVGNSSAASRVMQELQSKYKGTEQEKKLTNPKGAPEELAAKRSADLQYDKIYNLFIEGDFKQALIEKKFADSLYGKSYWTPQLLYIESVYFIKQRDDQTAITVLRDLTNTFPTSPMAPKAKTLIDVLGRRKQIEDYLTKLEIERPKEDSIGIINDQQQAVTQAPVVTPPAVDSAKKDEPVIKDADLAASKGIKKDTSQRNIAKAGNTDKLKRDPLSIAIPETPRPPGKDTATAAPPVVNKKDSAIAARPIVIAPGKPVFSFDPNAPHMVALILTKVDPVYITEARNAFQRYHKEKFYNKTFQVGNVTVTDTSKLLTISTFENAAAALDYTDKARKAATVDLIPWLPVNKYTFIVITEANLGLLQATKDFDTYKAFLQQVFPGKF